MHKFWWLRRFYDPATEGSGSTSPTPETKEPETKGEAEGEGEADDGAEKFYTLELPDGEQTHVRAKELIDLAKYGAHQLKLNRLNKETEETKTVEEETPEVKLTKLEKEVQELRDQRKNDAEVAKVHHILRTETDKYDSLKDDPDLKDMISSVSLAAVNINPRLDLAQVIKKNTLTLEKIIEKKLAAEKDKNKPNNYISKAMSGSVRGGGGVPTIDTSKKFTGADLKSGAVRKAMTEFLQKSGES